MCVFVRARANGHTTRMQDGHAFSNNERKRGTILKGLQSSVVFTSVFGSRHVIAEFHLEGVTWYRMQRLKSEVRWCGKLPDTRAFKMLAWMPSAWAALFGWRMIRFLHCLAVI